MNDYHGLLAYVVKECDKAERAWSEHMKQPEYCLSTNYTLYKKYIRLFNLLKLIDNTNTLKDNPQS